MALKIPSLSKTAQLSILLALTGSFFVVEIVVGYYSHSLALIADSFHMLSDVLSMSVALCAIRVTNRPSNKNLHPRYSYGLHRAEIVAALINGVFLLALCFTIFLDALGRFYDTHEVHNPKLVVIVGSAGLGCNLLGLTLFHGHDHGHGTTVALAEESENQTPSITRSLQGSAVELTQASAAERSNPPLTPKLHTPEETHPDPTIKHTHAHHGHHHHSMGMNMRAVMLHVLGDASGNIAVIVSGLVMWLSTWKGRFYIDPAVSLLFSVILFGSAFPLVRKATLVLLQAAPPHVSVDSVREAILSVQGVSSLHELHVWQLSESKAVASVHITTSVPGPSYSPSVMGASSDTGLYAPSEKMAGSEKMTMSAFMGVAAEIKRRLHELGVHSCTIQPEYREGLAPGDGGRGQRSKDSQEESDLEDAGVGRVERGRLSVGSDETLCMLPCPTDRSCDPVENACCPPRKVDSEV